MDLHPSGVNSVIFHGEYHMQMLWIETVHVAQRVRVNGYVRNRDGESERDHSIAL